MGQDSSQTGQADYYLAQVSSASLYYPFGWEMPGRKFVSGEEYRFGFNGKEGNPEIADGNLDFGARNYDGRIGRWWKVDLMESEAPSWTPYRFGFNNPIRYTDPDGNFEIDEATAAAYPKLNTMLQNISKVYAGRPEAFRKAFKKYSQLSDNEVEKMLEYKLVKNGTPIEKNQSNPRIQVMDLSKVNNGKPANGVTLFEFDNGIVNTQGTIILDEGLVEANEEQHLFESTAIGAELNLESTLLHEGTHYGDILDGTSDMTNNKNKEGGKDFENEAYGGDLGNGGIGEDKKVYDRADNTARILFGYSHEDKNVLHPKSDHKVNLNTGKVE